jgi:hypothetical protein
MRQQRGQKRYQSWKKKKPMHEESLTLKDRLGTYCQVAMLVWVHDYLNCFILLLNKEEHIRAGANKLKQTLYVSGVTGFALGSELQQASQEELWWKIGKNVATSLEEQGGRVILVMGSGVLD